MRRVLHKVEVLWSRYPDWRLGQLIENAAVVDPEAIPDVFYTEDDVLELGLDELLRDSVNLIERHKT